jgi:hypothetical protein
MNSAIDILKAERDKKLLELEQAKAAVRELNQSVNQISDALNLLTGTASQEINSRSAAREPLKYLIRKILENKPGLNPHQISIELGSVGRQTDVNTVLGTLSRARQENLIYKTNRVWYAQDESNKDTDATDKVEASAITEASDLGT